ncbi:MAG: hypothetical protein WCC90_16580 [Methylocella sp.]
MAGGRDQPGDHGYRRRKQARHEAALAIEAAQRREVLDRAERFVAELQAELAEAARCQVITAGIIGELSRGTYGNVSSLP